MSPREPRRWSPFRRAAVNASGKKDTTDAQEFAAAVREVCARIGATVESYSGDEVRLFGRITGLVNLAEVRRSCAPLPRDRWRSVIGTHLTHLARAAECGRTDCISNRGCSVRERPRDRRPAASRCRCR